MKLFSGWREGGSPPGSEMKLIKSIPARLIPFTFSCSLRGGAPMVRALCRQPDPVPDLLEIFPGSRDPVPDLSEICRKSPVGAEQAAQRLGSRKGRRLAAGRGAQLLWAAAWASGLHPGNQTPNCPRSPLQQPVSRGTPFSALSRRIGTSSVSP